MQTAELKEEKKEIQKSWISRNNSFFFLTAWFLTNVEWISAPVETMSLQVFASKFERLFKVYLFQW